MGFAIRKTVPWTRHPDLAALGLDSPDLRWGVDITVGVGSHVRGGLRVEKPNVQWIEIRRKRKPRIVIGPDARNTIISCRVARPTPGRPINPPSRKPGSTLSMDTSASAICRPA